MKRQLNINHFLLIVYLMGIFGIFAALVSPIIKEPVDLTPTKIPSLSISELTEANSLLNNFGKTWTQYPSEPNLSNYSFGGKDPL